MGLYAKDKGGEGFPPIDPGTHHAVCYGVVDIGTHENPMFNKKSHQVWIAWELPDVRIEFDRDGQHFDLPRTISKIYTLSINEEKANLGKDLVSWRGRPFTDEEKEGFDIFNVLEANCLLQVVHQQKNGKTYAKIAAVAKLMKNMQKIHPGNEILRYSIADNGFTIPENIPDWVKKLIQKSEEFQGGTPLTGDMDTDSPPPPEDDDIPF